MDPTHIRCKDLTPKIPDAFERLRKAQPSTNPNSAVAAWINDLQSELPRLQSLGRHPLRQIQQNSNPPKPTGHCAKQSQRDSRNRSVQRRMADNHTRPRAKQGRGRPRGSGGRGGRGRIIDDFKGVVQATDRPKELPDEDIISGDGDPLVDISPNLVLRPTESLSSSSRRSPTRSPTRSKAASAVVKRSQLAFMTPAIRFVSHETATERGGLPPVVESLWTNHIFQTLNRSDFIPPGLKVSVPQLNPRYPCLDIIHWDVTDRASRRSV